MDPTDAQREALKAIVCYLLAAHYREVIAYGAGWTDQERQQPVGDTGRHEPRQIDAILDVELHRALDDPDPLRGIAQVTARFCAAFVLDPQGVTRTKALGSERVTRKLRHALPGGDTPLRGQPSSWTLTAGIPTLLTSTSARTFTSARSRSRDRDSRRFRPDARPRGGKHSKSGSHHKRCRSIPAVGRNELGGTFFAISSVQSVR